MYGLVNKAVEDLVTTRFGSAIWQQIKQHAQITDEVFLCMDSYPDDITYQLVSAASAVLDLPEAEILAAFGEYWTLYTAQEGYGDLIQISGSTLPEFLRNLDEMHARVGLLFPQLQPPSFHCTDQTDQGLRLHYYSQRQGLASMVGGLLKGLGERFQTPIQIQMVADRSAGADHDEFLIQFQPL